MVNDSRMQKDYKRVRETKRDREIIKVKYS